MTIKPITLSDPMVPPVMAGTKLRTRRRMNPQPTADWMANTRRHSPDGSVFDRQGNQLYWVSKPVGGEIKLAYKPGDILYVRETHYAFGWWEEKEGEYKSNGKPKEMFVPTDDPNMNAIYFVNNLPDTIRVAHYRGGNYPQWYKRLARFMPKSYSRTFLKVTDVKAERVQSITEEEAQLEGVLQYRNEYGDPIDEWKNYSTIKGLRSQDGVECTTAISSFQTLWCELNGIESWKNNDWVWAYSFELTDRPADFLK